MNTVMRHECIILSFVICVAVTQGTVDECPKTKCANTSVFFLFLLNKWKLLVPNSKHR